MKIPKTPRPVIRETECEWVFSDEEGEIQTETVTIQYKGRTVKEARDFDAQLKQKEVADEDVYLSDIVGMRLVGIPKILGDKKITLDFLEAQQIENLNNILKAIADAENPQVDKSVLESQKK